MCCRNRHSVGKLVRHNARGPAIVHSMLGRKKPQSFRPQPWRMFALIAVERFAGRKVVADFEFDYRPINADDFGARSAAGQHLGRMPVVQPLPPAIGSLVIGKSYCDGVTYGGHAISPHTFGRIFASPSSRA